MTYKGFVGKVTYYDKERIFFGTVLGIKDVITFQGTTVDELEQAFKDSVDDYLDWYRELGEEPQRSYSGKFQVRMSTELHAKLALEAAQSEMSLNDLILRKLEK